jgi:hypothetical protein
LLSLSGSFTAGFRQLHFHKKTPAPAEVTGCRGDAQIEPAQITRLIFRGNVVEHEMRHRVPCADARLVSASVNLNQRVGKDKDDKQGNQRNNCCGFPINVMYTLLRHALSPIVCSLHYFYND